MPAATLEIGVELRISLKTVETHRENLKLKLTLRDAPALLRPHEGPLLIFRVKPRCGSPRGAYG